jgi:hypothetical protein
MVIHLLIVHMNLYFDRKSISRKYSNDLKLKSNNFIINLNVQNAL